jgi:hypothetical protein
VLATEVTIAPQPGWSETIGSWIGWAMGKESYQAKINRQVIETNAWLKELATRERLLLLDLQPVLAGKDGMRRAEFAKEDGSHITPAGYEALTKYALPILNQRFGQTDRQ